MFPIWVNDGTSEAPTDDIFYVVAKDGIYLKKSMGHFDTLSKVDGISILGECESYATLDIAKIPVRKFAQILSLFREVFKKYRAEANIILHYNIKRKRYRIDIPPQGVTGASVEYENGLETYKGYTRIGTIHSHAGMSAFHSGTDQHDEEGWDGLHITLGRMGDKYFDISCSIMSNKERFIVNPEDYIEGISLEEYQPVSQYQSYRYIGGVRELIEPAKKLGWVIDAEENDYKFPKKWMQQIGKYKPKPVYGHSIFQQFGNTASRGGNFQSLAEFYQFHQGLGGANLPSQENPRNGSYFADSTFEVDENEWSPCAQCPYRHHKSDILMKEILEELADDEFIDQELLKEDLEDEIEDENFGLHGNVYDPHVERNSPFHVEDKETPHGVKKIKK
jgi:hypothetical protein